MYHRWPALVLVLALCAVQARQAAGQDTLTQPRGRTQSFLGQNYPNPFKPDTHIPFTVGGCEGAVCGGTEIAIWGWAGGGRAGAIRAAGGVV